MKVVLTEPLKISDHQTLPAGQELDLEEATARDLIKAGRAKKVKQDQVAASRHAKPSFGPTETK